MNEERGPAEFHAIVEILGHRQIARWCTEEPIAGVSTLRLDAPAVGAWPAHTKYLGGGSIYAIHPCSEEHATAGATRLATRGGDTPAPISQPDMAEGSETLSRRQALRQEPARIGRGAQLEWDGEIDHLEYEPPF